MNDDLIRAIYEKIGAEERGIGFDEFKQDLQGDPALIETVYKKIGADERGIGLDEFTQDLGIQPEQPAPEPQAEQQERPRRGLLTWEKGGGEDADLSAIPSEALTKLGSGMANVNSWVARAPGMLYDVAVAPFANLVSRIAGGEGNEFSAAKLAESVGIDSNPIAEHYANNAKELSKEWGEKYDKSLKEYWENRDMDMFIGALAGHTAESIPATVGIIAASMAGAGPAAITIGGGIVFGAGEREDMKTDERYKDMSPEAQTAIAFTKGTLEGLTEQLGIVPFMSKTIPGIVKNEGLGAAKTFVERYAREVIQPSVAKYLGVYFEDMAGEVANQIGNNLIDIYVGGDKTLTPLSGTFDAAMISAASTTSFTTVTSALEYPARRKHRERLKQIDEAQKKQQNDLAILNSPRAQTTIAEKGKELAEEELRILQEAKNEFNSLPDDKRDRIIDLRNQKNEFERILSEVEITDDTRTALSERAEQIDAEINEILDGPQEREQPAAEELNFDFVDPETLSAEPMDFNLINSADGKDITWTQSPIELQAQLQSDQQRLTSLKDCI